VGDEWRMVHLFSFLINTEIIKNPHDDEHDCVAVENLNNMGQNYHSFD
jgi:hypothetical protein